MVDFLNILLWEILAIDLVDFFEYFAMGDFSNRFGRILKMEMVHISSDCNWLWFKNMDPPIPFVEH